MKKPFQYGLGSLISFEFGEYSDFRLNGILVALRDLDIPCLVHEYIKSRVEAVRAGDLPDYEQVNDPEGFMAWLVANQYAAPIEYSTLHFGQYSTFNDDILTEVPEKWRGYVDAEDIRLEQGDE